MKQKHRYIYGGRLSRCHVITTEHFFHGEPVRWALACGRRMGVVVGPRSAGGLLVITDPQTLPPRGQTLCRRCAKAIEVKK